MNNQEIKTILRKLNIPINGKSYVGRVRSSPPARAVDAGAFNVVDRIASRKMGMVIKSESRSAELPFLLSCEFNVQILEYYDQPEAIKIKYQKADGKRRADWITCDFLTIKHDEIALVECKKEEEAKKLCMDQPDKFIFDEELNRYICPPAIEAAKEMGMTHYISLDTDFTANFIRNCAFLFNFIDDKPAGISEQEAIKDFIVARGNRLKLDELKKFFSQKIIVQAILNGIVYADLENQLFINPEQMWIYHNSNCMKAYSSLLENHLLIPVKNFSDLYQANHLYIEAERYQVISCEKGTLIAKGARTIILSSDDVSRLMDSDGLFIEDVYAKSKIDLSKLLDTYSASEIESALKKQAELIKVKNKQKSLIPHSTMKRWKSNFNKSEQKTGVGFFGLIGRDKFKGNRSRRLGDANYDLIEKTIDKVVLTKVAPSTRYGFIHYTLDCNKKSITPCSMTTFYNHVDKISAYEFTLKREGIKAAYALGPKPLEHDKKHDAPAAGDFIFQLAHIDHTPLELDFTSAITGETFSIRLNMTLLIDSYSTVILAVYVTFEKPSYRSAMMVLRECYKVHGVLPLWVMCDGGPDFNSEYFQATFASFGINIRNRPKSSYRHGTTIERRFGVSQQQFIHNLQGNRKLKKYGRGQSPSHDSTRLAIWTPDEFFQELKDYIYETFPKIPSRGIKETPQDRFDRSRSAFEETPGVRIEAPHIFNFKTLPTHKTLITLHKNQLEFQGISYRLEKPVDGYEFGKIKVAVKYDPYNCLYIYIELNNRYVRMFTQDEIVRSCFDKGIILGFIEIYSRKIRHSRTYRKGSEALLQAHQNIQEKEERLFNQKNAILNQHKTTTSTHDQEAQSTEIDFDSLTIIPKQDL